MSVRLPLIKKQLPQDSPSSPQADREQRELESSIPQQQQNNSQPEDFEELIDPPAQVTPETVTVLKSRTQPEGEGGRAHLSRVEDQEGPSRKDDEVKIEELERILSEKVKTTAEWRARVDEKKKEIKSIGQKIDKDLNKSLLRAAKPSPVNIRDIFSAAPRTSNAKVNALNEELKRTRLAIKKIKLQIQRAQQGLNDPVTLINQDRGVQFKNKMKSTEYEIRTIEHEKQMLTDEIQRGGREFDEDEEKQKSEQLLKFTQELSELQANLKDQKMKLYHLEKEDILLMEKTKFYQEKEFSNVPKKQKLNPQEKDKIQQQMRQLISEINDIIEERNKTEVDKKNQTKHLSSEITSIEAKNMDLYNRLREIEAFLLQFYEKKSRRKEAKQMEQTVDVMEKSASGKVETGAVTPKNLNKSKFSVNDKNIGHAQQPLVEKKKNYEFGIKQQLDCQVNLSDQFLGPKIVLKSIEIRCYAGKIISLQTIYRNHFTNNVSGINMRSKNIPLECEILSISLEQQEVINFIHTGYGEDHLIAFLHLVTSEGKELKWGSQQNLVKSEQKHIKKYDSCWIKSKFTLVEQKDNQITLFLAGLTFSTIYLAPK